LSLQVTNVSDSWIWAWVLGTV